MEIPRNGPICVLQSGGLDSAFLLHRLVKAGRQVLPCYLRCGLHWEGVELYWLARFLKAMRSPRLAALQVVELPLRSLYGSHWSMTARNVPAAGSADADVNLPGRNVFLLSAAAVICAKRGISSVALGILKGNPFSDASPRFLRSMTSSLTQALGYQVRVFLPLSRSTKQDLIRCTREMPFALTFSCLKPQGRRHCGRCNKCAERIRAFKLAGIPDPTNYAGNHT